ncbi:MAG TPA: 3-hydroxybenzoate 6-monooxygenase [Burkholderiales bacterium]|nr:3-hydroxybenzoate 6-monooxygenase [Burkholderiales bacterium]
MQRARNALPVAVAGGGIGGLAAALALARKGFRSVVLEQAREFGEIGAGIQLAPNAWHAIDALGVGQLVKKEAVFIEQVLLMDGVTGEPVIEIPTDERFAKRFGNPYAVTHRADIHGSLLDGCRASELVELRPSSRVVGFSQGEEVTVRTSNGENLKAIALVGADGGRSVVREAIVGDGEPPASGHVCYRAVLKIEEMPEDLRWAAATLWAGTNTHIVHYPLRGWKLFNLVATVVRPEAVTAGHNEEAPPSEVLPLFAHNCEKILQLLRVPKSFKRWMLHFREPVDNWTDGRVALLGDAAHLMLQYFAQGAATALEDAVCLGACADAADGDFPLAFREYQDKRLVRASRVQVSAKLLGMLFHARDGMERRVRNAMYQGRAPGRYYDALEWLFTAPDYVRNFKKR